MAADVCRMRPMSRRAVDAMPKRRAERAGIQQRVHAHVLRHSMAMRMARRAPMPAVQAQLGHSSLSVTSEYLGHLSAADLVEAMNGC